MTEIKRNFKKYFDYNIPEKILDFYQKNKANIFPKTYELLIDLQTDDFEILQNEFRDIDRLEIFIKDII